MMKERFLKSIKSFDTWGKVVEIFAAIVSIVCAVLALNENPNSFVIAVSILSCQVIALCTGIFTFGYNRSCKVKMETQKELFSEKMIEQKEMVQTEKEKLQKADAQREAEAVAHRALLKRSIAFGANTSKRVNECLPVSSQRQQMYVQYNRFMAEIFREQEVMMTDYLRSVGREKELSFSLKLFTEIFDKNSSIDTAQLVTAFRDRKAYEEGKREVGKMHHALKLNGDFCHCLNHPEYVLNYMADKAMNIENSNYPACLAFYNCAVVVPIYVGSGKDKKVFGYFCCDTINPDPLAEVFDENTTNLMRSAAFSMAVFLDNANSRWADQGDGDILTFLDRKCREHYTARKL